MSRGKKTHKEIEFWQSNTDLMTGLILVLMLIVMLLILYLIQIPENIGVDTNDGNTYNVDSDTGEVEGKEHRNNDVGDENYDSEDNNRSEDNEETEENDEHSGGGVSADSEFEYEYPFPSHNGEDWNKAAVYATVVDEETGRAIRKKGITFELYEEQLKDDGGALRFLNTYYPVKTEYRNFETTERGVFYLPEKIEQGNYYFKQISELEGYDLTGEIQFTIDDVYDWPDPYVVSIAVSPSKNIIPITIMDADTHEPIQDGTFKIVAASDILTADSTVRFCKNDVADVVVFDENGYGESKELYLGKYIIIQERIPKYYASLKQKIDVEIKKKEEGTSEVQKLFCEKTKISLKLTDELYTNLKLEGAEFTLSCDAHPELTKKLVTDKNGELVFTDLEKDKVYKLRQVSAPQNYKFDDVEMKILVEEDGRINGETEASFELSNYIVRVNIDIKDKLFRKTLSNMNLALYDSNDQLIRTWTTSGSAETFENLPKGRYYILLEGDKNHKFELDFRDDKALQEFSLTIWTLQNIIIIVIGGVILLFVIFAVTRFLKRKYRIGKRK